MGFLSIWHWLIVLIVFLLVFGIRKGRITTIMKELAEGIKAFKKGADNKNNEH